MSVPLTMALSFSLLRSRYSRAQLLGATVVVTGIVGGFLPSVLHEGGNISCAWVFVFLLSRVPQALANVLIEKSLSGRPHVSWTFRATFYTQLLGLPLNFLSALILGMF